MLPGAQSSDICAPEELNEAVFVLISSICAPGSTIQQYLCSREHIPINAPSAILANTLGAGGVRSDGTPAAPLQLLSCSCVCVWLRGSRTPSKAAGLSATSRHTTPSPSLSFAAGASPAVHNAGQRRTNWLDFLPMRGWRAAVALAIVYQLGCASGPAKRNWGKTPDVAQLLQVLGQADDDRCAAAGYGLDEEEGDENEREEETVWKRLAQWRFLRNAVAPNSSENAAAASQQGSECGLSEDGEGSREGANTRLKEWRSQRRAEQPAQAREKSGCYIERAPGRSRHTFSKKVFSTGTFPI